MASAASRGPAYIWFPFLEATVEIMGNFSEETHIPIWVSWAVRGSGEHPFTLKQEASFLGESCADQNLSETRTTSKQYNLSESQPAFLNAQYALGASRKNWAASGLEDGLTDL